MPTRKKGRRSRKEDLHVTSETPQSVGVKEQVFISNKFVGKLLKYGLSLLEDMALHFEWAPQVCARKEEHPRDTSFIIRFLSYRTGR